MVLCKGTSTVDPVIVVKWPGALVFEIYVIT